MTPQTFIFIGRSGCGKGTQAKLLLEKLKEVDPTRQQFYLESGEEFRKLVKGTSYTSRLAKEIYDAGGMQPEFLPIWVWSRLFVDNLTEDEHILLDGMPRRLKEAFILDGALTFYKRESPHVFHIDVSREWSAARLSARLRGDDNPTDISARLNWFDTEVAPTIEHLKNTDIYTYHKIDGERPIEKVHEDILAVVDMSH